MKRLFQLMMQFLFMPLARGVNDSTERVIRVVSAAAANALGDVSGDGELHWHRMAKFGEYPVEATMADGSRRRVVQVVDKESGVEMARRLTSGINSIGDAFRGLPIYIGHPDDELWNAKNPGYKKIAVGRIKAIQTREDGIYYQAAWNDEGKKAISGPAAPLAAHSPNWGLAPIPGRTDAFRVVQLYSVGLVENSNIPNNTIGLNEAMETTLDPEGHATKKPITNTTMDPKILAALGLKPEASAQAINDAIIDLLKERDDTKAKLVTSEGLAKAANDQLAAFRKSAIETELASAVNDQRITEADKPKWQAALEADFDAEAAKLRAKMPAKALNSQDHVSGVHKPGEQPSGATGITAINDAVRSYAAEHKIDANTPEGWDKAFNGAKSAKPDLFK